MYKATGIAKRKKKQRKATGIAMEIIMILIDVMKATRIAKGL